MTRRRRFVLALALLAGAAQCGTTGGPPPAHAFPIQEFTLPSGLKVVIEQDDVSNIAGIVVVVDVGSVDDPSGMVGMAHVLEHLVLRVPDETGVSIWRRFHKLGAASFNALTGIERTTYHAFGPRQSLDDLVATLLGRLADPLRGAKQVHVSAETSIAAEEERRKEGASAHEYLMPALLPAGDPVGRAWAEKRHTDVLSLADVRAFADRYYRPERMTVVISGPIPAGWDKTLFTKMPAQLHGQEAERRAPVRRPVAAFAPPPPADGELPRHTAKVNVPELWIGWRIPPAIGVAAEKAHVIAYVMKQVLWSRLEPDGTNDVLDVEGFSRPGSLFSVVGCHFKLRSPADAVRIRNETKAALEALADITLMHIKGRLRWSHVYALQSATLTTALGMEEIQGRAMVRADLVHSGSSALISNVLDALDKVTVEEISDFAGRYLKPEAARSVLVVPEEMPSNRQRGTFADRSDAAASPGVDSDEELDRYGDADLDPPDNAKLAGITQAPGARAALVRKLPNGLTVIAMRRPGLPFASMLLGFHAEPQPGDAPGARIAFSRVLRWKVSEDPLERGLLRSTNHHADSTQESLRMFSANLEKALDFLSEEGDSLHVLWPNSAFGRWLDERAAWDAAPEGRAYHAFRRALFGSHPYQLAPTAAEAGTVTEPEIQAWLDRVRRPANGALVVVGEIDAEGVIREAGKALSGWKGGPAEPPAAPVPPQPRGGTAAAVPAIFYTEDARRKSADLRFGCFLPPVRARRDRVVNELLSNMFQQGLFNRLRWELGVSYEPEVEVNSVRGGTAWFNGRLDIDAKALPEALALLHAWLDGGRPFPVEQKYFEQLRWDVARRSGLNDATGQALARSLFRAWNMGWEPGVLDDYPRDLASVTIADVVAALDICRKSAVISVLGPGQ